MHFIGQDVLVLQSDKSNPDGTGSELVSKFELEKVCFGSFII